MTALQNIAPAFVEMAHAIVWCSAATVDAKGRPWSRVLHPLWHWDGADLVGWVATGPTPLKRGHLRSNPYVSCNYWTPSQDTCVAECQAEWIFDDDGRQAVWDRFVNAPAPVGYDPAVIPGWDDAKSPSFAALKLRPWRLRIQPGTVITLGEGVAMVWRRPGS